MTAFDLGFAQPAASGGSGWKAGEHENHLHLITPHEYIASMPTSMGETAAVRADITILDGPNAGETYSDQLIFQKVLVSALRSSAGTGQKILGRLGRGLAKPGQTAPYVLQPYTDADAALAKAFLTGNKPAPATATAAPAPAPAQAITVEQAAASADPQIAAAAALLKQLNLG